MHNFWTNPRLKPMPCCGWNFISPMWIAPVNGTKKNLVSACFCTIPSFFPLMDEQHWTPVSTALSTRTTIQFFGGLVMIVMGYPQSSIYSQDVPWNKPSSDKGVPPDELEIPINFHRDLGPPKVNPLALQLQRARTGELAFDKVPLSDRKISLMSTDWNDINRIQ